MIRDMMLWTHRQLAATAEELPQLMKLKAETQLDYLGGSEMQSDQTLLRRVKKELERRSQISE